jgi:hypothetical protein
MTRMILILGLFSLISCATTQPRRVKVGTETKLENVEPNWLDYADRSSVKITEINDNLLQGNWVAYFGCYKIEDTIQKGMALTIPNVIILNGNRLKHSKTGNEKEFNIIENKLYGYSNYPIDTGIINLIKSDSLIITWKYIAQKYRNDQDCQTNSRKTYLTRYYFKKEE